jgi:hypothetical protein
MFVDLFVIDFLAKSLPGSLKIPLDRVRVVTKFVLEISRNPKFDQISVLFRETPRNFAARNLQNFAKKIILRNFVPIKSNMFYAQVIMA